MPIPGPTPIEPGEPTSPPALSKTHLVLIPSYNPGGLLRSTVEGALAQWAPVWVVVDGSTDDSLKVLREIQSLHAHLRVIALAQNMGKGAAVLRGMEQAHAKGFTHVLTMDSDGQHPATLIPNFMAASMVRPEAMILGQPVFGPEAPRIRVWGRKISNLWAGVETLGAGVADSLYGFRVYPIAPLMKVMHGQTRMRRFDFDPEAVVRLSWAGVPPVNLSAPVRYFQEGEGGVSHFKYLRDNTLLTWMHIRLVGGLLIRLPKLVAQRLMGR